MATKKICVQSGPWLKKVENPWFKVQKIYFLKISKRFKISPTHNIQKA